MGPRDAWAHNSLHFVGVCVCVRVRACVCVATALMHCDVPVIYSYVLGNREPAAINHVSKTTSPNHVFIKNFKTHGGRMSTI